MPIFGKIDNIFIEKEKAFFLCKEWHSKYLAQELNAYYVVEEKKIRLVDADNLPAKKPLAIWKKNNSNDNFNPYILLSY